MVTSLFANIAVVVEVVVVFAVGAVVLADIVSVTEGCGESETSKALVELLK